MRLREFFGDDFVWFNIGLLWLIGGLPFFVTPPTLFIFVDFLFLKPPPLLFDPPLVLNHKSFIPFRIVLRAKPPKCSNQYALPHGVRPQTSENRFTVRFAKAINRNYPEMAKTVTVVRAPTIFTWLWDVAGPLLLEVTLQIFLAVVVILGVVSEDFGIKRPIKVWNPEKPTKHNCFALDRPFSATWGGDDPEEGGHPGSWLLLLGLEFPPKMECLQ